jgi:acyl phosphate:glycerol-3-phosphate acyltransferase
MTTGLLVLAAAYLIGGIPFGYLLVKLRRGEDVRTLGSGNIGATNVLRTSGTGLGVLTLLLDVAKGAFGVWLADRFLHGSTGWMSAAALAVMAGHAFPIYLRFRGGKAVASFVGAFLYLAPVPMLACLVVFAAVVAYSRHISLGSITAAGLFPFGVWLIEHPPAPVVLAAAAAGAFIVVRHRANIARIRAGNEHVFSLGGRR